MLTEAQLVVLERAKHEKEVHGEFKSECPGYCGAQDTFHVGSLKGGGSVYQQTFVDTYSKVAFAKLYDRKTRLPAADLLNDRVVPFFDGFGIPLLRVLTDRGAQCAPSSSAGFNPKRFRARPLLTPRILRRLASSADKRPVTVRWRRCATPRSASISS